MPFLRSAPFTVAEGTEPLLALKQVTSFDQKMENQRIFDTTKQVAESAETAYEHAIHELEDSLIEGNQPGAAVTSSQMPSPPDSRSPTPRFNLDLCPKRLYPFIPPRNYGAVFEYTMYRSSFPQRENMDFLESLELRSILTLTTKNDPCETYRGFVDKCGVSHKIMELETNKEGAINMKPDKMCEAILFALNPAHHPVHVHCNQGRHRTGCFVACIRKIQGWPMNDIIHEYETYASPKPRDGDIAFIRQFDPAAVYSFADKNPHMRWRSDSVLDTFDLLAGLPKSDFAFPHSSAVSDTSDPGLIMPTRRVNINSALIEESASVTTAQETIIDREADTTETVLEIQPAYPDDMEDMQ